MDVREIAIDLEENFPDKEILSLRFTELKHMILTLNRFKDDPVRSNEKTLEAIQMAWLDERT